MTRLPSAHADLLYEGSFNKTESLECTTWKMVQCLRKGSTLITQTTEMALVLQYFLPQGNTGLFQQLDVELTMRNQHNMHKVKEPSRSVAIESDLAAKGAASHGGFVATAF
eukprot:794076-Pleurochrysis_carterae.AAC.1